jgi:AraC-like DNA-binding protein
MKPKAMPVVWCPNLYPDDPSRTAQIGVARDTMKEDTKPFHSHPNGQFAVAIKGLVCLETEANRYVVPMRCAVWTPPGVRHYGLLGRDAQAFYFMISPEQCRAFPRTPVRLMLNAMTFEILLYLSRHSDEMKPGSRCERLALAAIEQLAIARQLPAGFAPIPDDPLLRELAFDVSDPANFGLDNKDWAARLGMSERTLSRRILLETGLSFRLWRQHIRFLPALSMLAQGKSVEEVSDSMHYETASAFISAFRRVFGMTPGVLRKDF